MSNGLRQIQIKFGGAVMQNVDVLVPCVGGAVGLVTVPVSTAAAYGFGPVVTGVIGVLAGDTGIQTTYRYFVNTHPVGILDVAVQGRLTGAGILRNTPDGEIRVFPAGGAVEGLMGDDGVDIQCWPAANARRDHGSCSAGRLMPWGSCQGTGPVSEAWPLHGGKRNIFYSNANFLLIFSE